MAITLTTEQAVLDKATPFANATLIASSAMIQRYIEEAEGHVIGQTQIDWITGFTDINAKIKIELSACVSAFAANNIISYDMSGFSPSETAVTTLNVNNRTFKDSLKELKQTTANKPRAVKT